MCVTLPLLSISVSVSVILSDSVSIYRRRSECQQRVLNSFNALASPQSKSHPHWQSPTPHWLELPRLFPPQMSSPSTSNDHRQELIPELSFFIPLVHVFPHSISFHPFFHPSLNPHLHPPLPFPSHTVFVFLPSFIHFFPSIPLFPSSFIFTQFHSIVSFVCPSYLPYYNSFLPAFSLSSFHLLILFLHPSFFFHPLLPPDPVIFLRRLLPHSSMYDGKWMAQLCVYGKMYASMQPPASRHLRLSQSLHHCCSRTRPASAAKTASAATRTGGS